MAAQAGTGRGQGRRRFLSSGAARGSWRDMIARMSGGKARGGWRRALRVAGWNAALLAAGLALIAAGGEIYLRATGTFVASRIPRHFVPGVGYVYPPGAEIRHTNHVDFWTVSRANSLGFTDREPVGPVRAAASCHVAAIGDSFVDALEVPIADKFHVRPGGAGPPGAAAPGRHDLGVRPPRSCARQRVGLLRPVRPAASPRLVVLVLTLNDLWGNSPAAPRPRVGIGTGPPAVGFRSKGGGRHPDAAAAPTRLIRCGKILSAA